MKQILYKVQIDQNALINVAMVKYIQIYVMIVIMLMVMDVHQYVLFNLDIHVFMILLLINQLVH